MPQTLYGQILFAFIVGVCLLALWQGDKIERRAGALIIINNIVAFAIQHQATPPLSRYLNLANELACLVLLILLAWRSAKSWPIWAASCQAITFAVLVARIAGLRMLPDAYATAVNLATYGLMISLGIGTFIVWREREALRGMASGL